MKNKRFERGLERLNQIDGEGGEKVISSLKEIAPDLGDYIVEFAFGDIYSREGLNLQEREIVTLASLLTQGGCEAQLEVHIQAALNVGLTPEKIIECFLQCIPYVGFPRVLNAVFLADKLFKKSNKKAADYISGLSSFNSSIYPHNHQNQDTHFGSWHRAFPHREGR